MSVYDNLKIYFDKYIKQYLPYKGNKVFQSLCAVLKELFFKDSYKEIPHDLSLFVEDQKVTSQLYNKLLIGNGYPYNIVESITDHDKLLILINLMHYQNDQGDLRHFKQIASLFKDPFNIYELYADYRLILDGNEPRLNWIMAGKPIYKCNNEPDPIYDYDEIYNATPTYFLSRQQIDYWRLTKSLVLPFKTNLMSLEWQNITEYSESDNIVTSNVFSYFQYQTLSLIINDDQYTITVGDLYQLFNYFLSYVEGETFVIDTAIKMVTVNIRGTPVFDLSSSGTNSLEDFIKQSESVNDAESFHFFYNNYISNNYSTFLSGNGLTLADIRTKIYNKFGSALLSYFENLINSASNKLNGLYNVVTILKNTLETFIDESSDPNAQKYRYWLIHLFEQVNINPKNTTTYKLLLQFKPYHTQFILLEKYKLIYKKDNSWIRDDVFFVDHNYEHSAVVISDDYFLKQYIVQNDPSPCFKFQNDPLGFRGCHHNLSLQYVEIGSMISLCTDKDNDIYDPIQFIGWEVEPQELTTNQYNSVLSLFDPNSYKYQFIQEAYSITNPHYTREFYKNLALKNKEYYYYFQDQFDRVFNLYWDDNIHRYNPDIELVYDSVINTITNTKLKNSLTSILSYTTYHLEKKVDLINDIANFKEYFKNAFKDFNNKYQFLPKYEKDSKKYYDVNNLNGLVSEIFSNFNFVFNILQVVKTFPLMDQNPVLSSLNYIKLQFNQDVVLNNGTIELLSDLPNDSYAINNGSNVLFIFNKSIKPGTGKFLLQPKDSYSIEITYFESPANSINLKFNKNIVLNNGKIVFEPVIQYISEDDFQKQLQDLVSSFNYFITVLETSVLNSDVISQTNSNHIICEKFDKLVQSKINNSSLIHVLKFYNYWKTFRTANIIGQYKVVNYSQFNNAFTQISSQLKFTKTEKVNIWDIITQNENAIMLTDREWTGPIDMCFPQMVVSTLPPVEEVVYINTGLFTFTNVESAKYVHTNMDAFLSIYIGDYIWVVQDTKKYAVKVVGKDLNEMNLEIDKTYRGTAGSFNSVGRYRSGFYKQQYKFEDDFI